MPKTHPRALPRARVFSLWRVLDAKAARPRLEVFAEPVTPNGPASCAKAAAMARAGPLTAGAITREQRLPRRKCWSTEEPRRFSPAGGFSLFRRLRNAEQVRAGRDGAKPQAHKKRSAPDRRASCHSFGSPCHALPLPSHAPPKQFLPPRLPPDRQVSTGIRQYAKAGKGLKNPTRMDLIGVAGIERDSSSRF